MLQKNRSFTIGREVNAERVPMIKQGVKGSTPLQSLFYSVTAIYVYDEDDIESESSQPLFSWPNSSLTRQIQFYYLLTNQFI